MVFSSTVFMFIFLPAVFLLSYVLPGIKAKNILLTAASLFFYAWGEPVYVLLMLFSVSINYLLALPAGKRELTDRRRKTMVALTVIFNVGLLALFKYTAFVVSTINLFGAGLTVPEIPLPIGISFYTFQVMSYVIDTYRDVVPVQRSYGKVLMYVSLFPQLIAGPIVKYSDVADQIDNRQVTLRGVASGIRRFVFGLAKKLLIANGAGLIVDALYALPSSELNALCGWLAAISYCIQIYYDFSGYSDMAIGLGSMAGFEFKENFNYPYTAVSIRDFWRRWHISLSTWFREYVYIPLGGNRKGSLRTGLNKFAVFVLTGLWHGASWTFVAWGLLHGLFIMLESYGVLRPEKWKPRLLGRIYTLLVVCIAFVLFRADSFAQAWDMLRAMFTGFDITEASLLALQELCPLFNLVCVGLGILFSAPILRPLWNSRPRLTARSRAASAVGYVLTIPLYILCIALVAVSTYNPFIYFRF